MIIRHYEEKKCLTSCAFSFKKRELQRNQEYGIKKRQHKVWLRKILTERKWKGEYHHLVQQLKLN